MANYMFEVTVSNSVNNQTQNVPGKFGTNTGSSFEPAICQAGTLCVRNGLIPSEGYASFEGLNIMNGNTWYFNTAPSGGVVAGFTGDHTGIFAFNNYNVNKAVDGQGNAWNLGMQTLGLPLPADERGDFTELMVGEQYTFGESNFTNARSTNNYATVGDNGQWTFAASAPSTTDAVYAVVLREKPVNQGTRFWGTGYVLQIVRGAVQA